MMQGSHSRGGQRVDAVEDDDDPPPPWRTSPETIVKPISWVEGGGFVIAGFRSGGELDEDVSASSADTVSWTITHHDESHRDDRTTTDTTEGTVERDDESGGGRNARHDISSNAPANTLASATMMIKNEANTMPDPDHYRPARRVRLEVKEVGSPQGRDPVTLVLTSTVAKRDTETSILNELSKEHSGSEPSKATPESAQSVQDGTADEATADQEAAQGGLFPPPPPQAEVVEVITPGGDDTPGDTPEAEKAKVEKIGFTLL